MFQRVVSPCWPFFLRMLISRYFAFFLLLPAVKVSCFVLWPLDARVFFVFYFTNAFACCGLLKLLVESNACVYVMEADVCFQFCLYYVFSLTLFYLLGVVIWMSRLMCFSCDKGCKWLFLNQPCVLLILSAPKPSPLI